MLKNIIPGRGILWARARAHKIPQTGLKIYKYGMYQCVLLKKIIRLDMDQSSSTPKAIHNYKYDDIYFFPSFYLIS